MFLTVIEIGSNLSHLLEGVVTLLGIVIFFGFVYLMFKDD